ncbi:transmembrane inner ear expressed protein-like [Centruroides sculpturatus]|uniref:transmembrane inner ear expressed protein-like n=1 Tax=Centruroides sculpturatus TaxID=218467 RepID=UPI000C6E3156|nr:transmembrane inner ear expressed protein-like [Centruroides sculpturatus]
MVAFRYCPNNFFYFFIFTSTGNVGYSYCEDEESTTASTSFWLEQPVIAGFRVWHILFLILAGIIAVIVFLCCFMKCRIPRTKQEIEADYIRKKLTRRFRCFLDQLTMDDMNLRLALEKVKDLYDSNEINQSEDSKLSQLEENKTEHLEKNKTEHLEDTKLNQIEENHLQIE